MGCGPNRRRRAHVKLREGPRTGRNPARRFIKRKRSNDPAGDEKTHVNCAHFRGGHSFRCVWSAEGRKRPRVRALLDGVLPFFTHAPLGGRRRSALCLRYWSKILILVRPTSSLRGETFGLLLVLYRTENDRSRHRCWLCRCSCGVEKIVREAPLRRGLVKSCGCLCKKTKHGHSLRGKPSRTYMCWSSMIQRCNNPNHRYWKHYGGRGIQIHPDWLIFKNFLRDMGELPKGLSLDRVDNNGDYEKENCKWSTPKEQTNNRRCSPINKLKTCGNTDVGL